VVRQLTLSGMEGQVEKENRNTDCFYCRDCDCQQQMDRLVEERSKALMTSCDQKDATGDLLSQRPPEEKAPKNLSAGKSLNRCNGGYRSLETR
jgi:hypothetical protein